MFSSEQSVHLNQRVVFARLLQYIHVTSVTISYSRDANVLYSRDIVFYIQGTSIWIHVKMVRGGSMFRFYRWKLMQCSGGTKNVRWDNFIDRWETLWTGPGVWLFQEQQTDNIGDEHLSNIRYSDRYMHLMNICTNRLNDITHTSYIAIIITDWPSCDTSSARYWACSCTGHPPLSCTSGCKWMVNGR